MSSVANLTQSLADYDVLVLPGWRNSGPAHWQSHWETLFPAFQRVQQQDWQQPRRADWIKALDKAVDAASKPVILIAHSLGCVTVTHWAAQFDTAKVAAALLVAPADVERSTVASSLRNFSPLPQRALPFRTVLVGSDNDPCCSAWRAVELAETWGAEFHLLSGAGHINADSGLGDWPEGLELLAQLPPQDYAFGGVSRRQKPAFVWAA